MNFSWFPSTIHFNQLHRSARPRPTLFRLSLTTAIPLAQASTELFFTQTQQHHSRPTHNNSNSQWQAHEFTAALASSPPSPPRSLPLNRSHPSPSPDRKRILSHPENCKMNWQIILNTSRMIWKWTPVINGESSAGGELRYFFVSCVRLELSSRCSFEIHRVTNNWRCYPLFLNTKM